MPRSVASSSALLISTRARSRVAASWLPNGSRRCADRHRLGTVTPLSSRAWINASRWRRSQSSRCWRAGCSSIDISTNSKPNSAAVANRCGQLRSAGSAFSYSPRQAALVVCISHLTQSLGDRQIARLLGAQAPVGGGRGIITTQLGRRGGDRFGEPGVLPRRRRRRTGRRRGSRFGAFPPPRAAGCRRRRTSASRPRTASARRSCAPARCAGSAAPCAP